MEIEFLTTSLNLTKFSIESKKRSIISFIVLWPKLGWYLLLAFAVIFIIMPIQTWLGKVWHCFHFHFSEQCLINIVY